MANDTENPMNCGYRAIWCEITTTTIQGVCPEGWHLPYLEEWNTLFTAVGGSSIAGKKIKSVTGWEKYGDITNEDAFGFSALPAGFRSYSNEFDVEGSHASFWSFDEYDSYYANDVYMESSIDNANEQRVYKNSGHSVRCVKN